MPEGGEGERDILVTEVDSYKEDGSLEIEIPESNGDLENGGPPPLEKIANPTPEPSTPQKKPPPPKSRSSARITETGMSYVGICGFPLLDPKSKFTFIWDTGVAVLLLYTALVTPFEVSFLETSLNGLFFFNRGVDTCFLIDMLMNFVRPYQNDLGEWVYDHPDIIRKYAKSWFPIDIVSIAPFDVVGLVSANGAASQLKVVRIIRLLRLAKLMRILRAGRMFARWESSMPIDYMKLELSKFLGVVMALAHWLACGWHMCKVIESGTGVDVNPDNDNWIDNYAFISESTSAGSKFLASLYWSIATLSTLGYGDVVPTTDAERLYVVFATIVGSSVYAYMIGNVCGMLAGMDIRNAKFYETMKQLNTFMDEKNIPQKLREQLREYFRFRRNHGDISDWHELLSSMSPALRVAVSGCVHAKWVSNVVCFQDSPPDFMACLAMAFRSETYGTREIVFSPGMPAMTLYIVERGVTGVGGRIMNKEKSFGEEMLYSASAVRRTTATTLTHCVFLTLDRDELMAILHRFPQQNRKMRKYVIKVLFRQNIKTYVAAVKRAEREGVDSTDTLPIVLMQSIENGKANMNMLWATMVFQRHIRKFISKKRRAKAKLQDQKHLLAQKRFNVILQQQGLEKYTKMLGGEGVTVEIVNSFTPAHLGLVSTGMKIGDAHKLVSACNQAEADRNRPVQLSGIVSQPMSPG